MVTGAGAVVALVMLEWTAGLAGVAAWAQTWSVVRRGHFRIVAWSGAALALIGLAATEPGYGGARGWAAAAAVAAVLWIVSQYAARDVLPALAGGICALLASVAVMAIAVESSSMPAVIAAAGAVAGAALLGGVTNGMLLGHWYLNQPGLKPWALARLTALTLVAVAAAGVLGLAGAPDLVAASTDGAVLGLPGFGASFGTVFFTAWMGFVLFTGGIVWMARRCVAIRSIQSATGLLYVALLTAGVAEFVVRYLMVHA